LYINIHFQSHREQRLHHYREEFDKAFQLLAVGRLQLGAPANGRSLLAASRCSLADGQSLIAARLFDY